MVFAPNDKRGFRRMSATGTVQVKAVEDSDWQTGRMENLSATGILILHPRSFAADAEIEVQVEPADDRIRPLQGRARVVRSSPTSAGFELACEFIELR